MDAPRLIHLFPIPYDRELADVAVAIQLVASGGARRVTLSGLRRPEAIALEALALAQAARVGFALQRQQNGAATIVVGPVEE